MTPVKIETPAPVIAPVTEPVKEPVIEPIKAKEERSPSPQKEEVKVEVKAELKAEVEQPSPPIPEVTIPIDESKLTILTAGEESLPESDSKSLHNPSHIKNEKERIQGYVDEIHKQKRVVEDLVTKLGMQQLRFVQHQETTDKKFANLENMVR